MSPQTGIQTAAKPFSVKRPDAANISGFGKAMGGPISERPFSAFTTTEASALVLASAFNASKKD
jgi:hypothetical protein